MLPVSNILDWEQMSLLPCSLPYLPQAKPVRPFSVHFIHTLILVHLNYAEIICLYFCLYLYKHIYINIFIYLFIFQIGP